MSDQIKVTISKSQYETLKRISEAEEMPVVFVLRGILKAYFTGGFVTTSGKTSAPAAPPPPPQKRPGRELRLAIHHMRHHRPTGPQPAPKFHEEGQERFAFYNAKEGFDWTEDEAIEWLNNNPRTKEEEKLWKKPADSASDLMRQSEAMAREVMQMFKDNPID